METTTNNSDTPYVPSFLRWLFPYKKKKLFFSIKSPSFYYLFQNKISLTFVNWLFQGMMGMHATDLTGKIIFELVFFFIFVLLLNEYSIIYRVCLTFFLSHTLNWLLNSHFWTFGRFLGITHTDRKRFSVYLKELRERVDNDASIVSIIIIGSISRNEGFRTTSDVDIVFIRKEGFPNAVRAVLVTVRERATAFLNKFPLELHLYDSVDTMKKHRADEIPVILKDTCAIAQSWYSRTGRTVTRLEDFER